MDFKDLIQFVLGINWQSVVALFAINWFFYSLLKERINKIDNRIDNLENRMFYLATGRTLEQAMLDEKRK